MSSDKINALENKLNFYKKIDAMLNEQKNGFDVAYEIEKEIERIKKETESTKRIFENQIREGIGDRYEKSVELSEFKNLNRDQVRDLNHLINDAKTYKRNSIPLDSSLANEIRKGIGIIKDELDYLYYKREKNSD